MFSQSQILQDLPKQFFVNLVAKVNAKQAEGYDVINLGQGNPDQPTYDFIVDALIASAKNPVSHKYSSFRGNAHFKEAVIRLILIAKRRFACLEVLKSVWWNFLWL